jgi:hypothetical protein
MPHALLQLVSEQTLPNLFPALALEPDSLVLLHTPQTARQCDWIEQALLKAQCKQEVRRVELRDNPDHHATGHAIKREIAVARAADLAPVVNITGGTKLMSIGAFAAAYQEKIPACYVDTAHRLFIAASNIPLPAPLDTSPIAFRKLADRLNVPVMAAAHGIGHFTPGRDPSPWLPTARLIAKDPQLETATHEFAQNFLQESGRRPADYHRLLATPLDQIPDPLVEPLASSGHIHLQNGHWHLWHPQPECFARWASGEVYDSIQSYFDANAPIQQLIGFLSGGWWELAVLEAAQASGRFRDIHWSPKVSRPDVQTSIEEDLLAIEDIHLAVFSCKRGGERGRLLRAFEELDSSARNLGGVFARRYLAIAQPIAKHHLEEVQARARSTRTTLIGPAAHLRPDSFR